MAASPGSRLWPSGSLNDCCLASPPAQANPEAPRFRFAPGQHHAEVRQSSLPTAPGSPGCARRPKRPTTLSPRCCTQQGAAKSVSPEFSLNASHEASKPGATLPWTSTCDVVDFVARDPGASPCRTACLRLRRCPGGLCHRHHALHLLRHAMGRREATRTVEVLRRPVGVEATTGSPRFSAQPTSAFATLGLRTQNRRFANDGDASRGKPCVARGSRSTRWFPGRP